MKTVPGIIPCSNSSSSRTSRNVASPRRASAPAGATSRISDFLCFRRWRKLAMKTPPGSIRGLNPTAAVGYSQWSDEADQGREHLTQAVADDDVGQGIERRLLRIEDHQSSAVAKCDLGEPGRGIHRQRGSDREKDVGPAGREL